MMYRDCFTEYSIFSIQYSVKPLYTTILRHCATISPFEIGIAGMSFAIQKLKVGDDPTDYYNHKLALE